MLILPLSVLVWCLFIDDYSHNGSCFSVSACLVIQLVPGILTFILLCAGYFWFLLVHLELYSGILGTFGSFWDLLSWFVRQVWSSAQLKAIFYTNKPRSSWVPFLIPHWNRLKNGHLRIPGPNPWDNPNPKVNVTLLKKKKSVQMWLRSILSWENYLELSLWMSTKSNL